VSGLGRATRLAIAVVAMGCAVGPTSLGSLGSGFCEYSCEWFDVLIPADSRILRSEAGEFTDFSVFTGGGTLIATIATCTSDPREDILTEYDELLSNGCMTSQLRTGRVEIHSAWNGGVLVRRDIIVNTTEAWEASLKAWELRHANTETVVVDVPPCVAPYLHIRAGFLGDPVSPEADVILMSLTEHACPGW